MSMRFKGARLSATAPTTTASSAVGLWTMRQQLQAIAAGLFPGYVAPGQQLYSSTGTYTWVAPAGVTSVCVVCVGPTLDWANNAYLGRGGGGLGWKNNITVVPGNSYTVVVGSSSGSGTDSYFISTATVKGGAAQDPSTGGTYVGDGGGNGGNGGAGSYGSVSGGGGGAGGYAGNGGNGASSGSGSAAATNSGGGGGGASQASGVGGFGGGGGGVSVYGLGTTGDGGIYGTSANYEPGGGRGGSYGNNGTVSNTGGAYAPATTGGGAAGTAYAISGGPYSGAVRIIWGAGRAFPSTNTFNQ